MATTKKDEGPKVKVLQAPEQEPVEREVLAQSIVKIADGFNALMAGGLTDRALVVLLRDYTGVGMSEIRAVLGGLRNLKRVYTRP